MSEIGTMFNLNDGDRIENLSEWQKVLNGTRILSFRVFLTWGSDL